MWLYGSGLSRLSSIHLEGNQISSQGVTTLCNLMVGNTALNLISLSNNPIGDEGAKILSKLLANQSSLAALYLDRIGIGDVGLKHIAMALSSQSSLTDISLKFNNAITEIGTATLRKALSSHAALPPNVLRDIALKESEQRQL